MRLAITRLSISPDSSVVGMARFRLPPAIDTASLPAILSADRAGGGKAQEAAMEKRRFGRTGLDVSVLGFGCGAVGGLMVKGEPADQERAVSRALELGINYFDTAQMYG